MGKSNDGAALGSPPRVRGIVGFAYFTDDEKGITPACAGNSYSGLFIEMKKRDHPRVCGE